MSHAVRTPPARRPSGHGTNCPYCRRNDAEPAPIRAADLPWLFLFKRPYACRDCGYEFRASPLRR